MTPCSINIAAFRWCPSHSSYPGTPVCTCFTKMPSVPKMYVSVCVSHTEMSGQSFFYCFLEVSPYSAIMLDCFPTHIKNILNHAKKVKDTFVLDLKTFFPYLLCPSICLCTCFAESFENELRTLNTLFAKYFSTRFLKIKTFSYITTLSHLRKFTRISSYHLSIPYSFHI